MEPVFAHRLNYILVMILLLLNGCLSQKGSEVKEFTRVTNADEVPAEEVPDFQLGQFGDTNLNLRARRVFKMWGRDIEMPHLEVKIISPSKVDFDRLKKTYGFGLSRVQYQPDTSYDLIDFMTPFIQAVDNTFFVQEITDEYDLLSANCWTTGYEFIRTANKGVESFYVFYAGADQIQAQIQNADYSKEVAVISGHEEFPYEKMQFGDLILFYYGDGELYHVAIYIDHDIFFEKVALVSHSPYRLTLKDDFFYRLQEDHKIEIRRFGNRKLPNPREVMTSSRSVYDKEENSVSVETIPLVSRETFIIFDEQGRAKLAPESFAAIFRRLEP